MLLPTKSPHLEKFMQSPRIYLLDKQQGSIHALANHFASKGFVCELLPGSHDCHEQINASKPSCVIVDAQSPALENETLLKHLHGCGSPAAVLVITHTVKLEQVVAFMRAGAYSVVQRSLAIAGVIAQVERAMEHSKKRHAASVWLRELNQRYAKLDSQQRNVLELLLAGKTSITAAKKLDLSTRTLDRRRKSTLETMQVKSLVELAVLMGRRFQEMQNHHQVG